MLTAECQGSVPFSYISSSACRLYSRKIQYIFRDIVPRKSRCHQWFAQVDMLSLTPPACSSKTPTLPCRLDSWNKRSFELCKSEWLLTSLRFSDTLQVLACIHYETTAPPHSKLSKDQSTIMYTSQQKYSILLNNKRN